MKWQEVILVIAVCSLLMGVVASTPDAAKPVKNSILEEYQRIQEGNGSFRSFNYEDGAPKDVNSTTRDNYGYLWLQHTDTNSVQVYRFTGAAFMDLQKEEKLLKTDSLAIPIIQTRDKYVHLATRHYLLRWIGYRFIRYAFPKDDRIIEAMAVDNRVLCIGTKGYAVLNGKRWSYRRTPIEGAINADRRIVVTSFNSIYTMNSSATTLDGVGNPVNYFLEKHIVLEKDKGWSYTRNVAYPWSNDFVIQCYTKTGRQDLTVLAKEQINRLAGQEISIDPILSSSPGGDPHIYFIGTNLIFRIDGDKRKVLPKHLPEGSKILAITKDKEHNPWICYEQDKHLYLQDLGDAITPMGMKYYLPDGEYAPAMEYYIQLDDETRMFAKNTATQCPRALFRLNRGYPELSKCDFPEINSKGDYIYPVLKYFSHYLCLSIPRKDMPGVHRIYLYDMLNGQKEHVDVADPASKLSCLDFNPDSRIVMVKGRDKLLALPFRKTISQVKAFDIKDGSISALESGDYVGLIAYKWGSPTEKIQTTIYSHRLGQISMLYNTDNGYYLDNWKSERAYIRVGGNPPTLREVDLQNGKVKVINPKTDSFALLPNAEGCYLLYGDMSIEKFSSSGVTSYSASSITTTLEPTAKQAGLDMSLLWNYPQPQLIGEDLIFYPYIDRGVNEDGEGHKNLEIGRIGGEPDKLPPQKLEYVSGNNPQLRIPSFTYNLKDGKIAWQPNWISVGTLPKQEGDAYLVKYWEGTKEKGRIRFSRFEKGKLIPTDRDFTYSFQNGLRPWINRFHDKNGVYYEVEDKLYCLKGKEWIAIPLADFKGYGSLTDVDKYGEDLWLTFESALVRHNLASGQSFVFGSKDGIPTELSDLYQEEGKFYLLSKSGVYHFTPEEVGATLSIPWLQANGAKYGATLLNRFSPKQNNLIIPVDILNTLFPERMKLTYCLVGYDKEWKSRDYTPQIEYPQLPPGKYEFQIYATSPTGRQSSTLSIPFRIRHPWYANVWAYLFYALGMALLARYLYLLRVQQLQQRNKMLEDTITDRTRELKERQQRLDSSIEYASLIQKSILPQESDLISAFREHFIIWKPRDVVGGDFYWLHTTPEGETIFALVDCTGHGVPGALLSMTVNSLLHTLVKDRGLESPAEVFAIMHREIGTALHQEKAHTVQDGLEIAMIRLNQQKTGLVFCGAGLHLLYLDNDSGELVQMRGDKYGIGGLRSHQVLTFTEHQLSIDNTLQFYLYTDGILDQPLPQGTRFRSMGHPYWLEFLTNLAQESFSRQRQAIEKQLHDMLILHEQRDDITVTGFKV